MVSREHMEKVLSYVDLAKKEGGEILCGGKRIFLKGKLKEGYYISPTVISGLNHLCKTNQEEILESLQLRHFLNLLGMLKALTMLNKT